MRSSASRLYLTDDLTNPAAIPLTFIEESRLRRPVPLQSNALLAAARRLTGNDTGLARQSPSITQSWQEDAWDLFDLVGEQRFLMNTLASRVSQVQFYIGKINPNEPRDQPEAVKDPEIAAILEPFGGTHTGRTQIIKRLAVNLLVAGDGWLAGIPRRLIPGTVEYEQERTLGNLAWRPVEDTEPDISSLEWLMLSVSEISRTRDKKIELLLNAGPEGKLEVDPDDIYLIRVWNPHPRRSWEADSPTRASLPVLRELVGLTMDISAQLDSRLAGAGLLIVPQSAQRALAAAASAGNFDESTEDLFTEALIEAMLTPIKDRGSASALVPLVITVPDEATDKFQHIRFGRDLEASGIEMRSESIRRLALGQDAPPELLLGTAGMNHWGAWLVREDVVTTHIEPPAALICDALTTQYLWPVLAENFDMPLEEYRNYVVWYDVSDMVARPNRANDAKDLHQRGAINDEALRRETGFEETDAPLGTEAQPVEVVLAMNMVKSNPGLITSPGLRVVIEEIRAALAGEAPDEEIVGVPAPPVEESEGTVESDVSDGDPSAPPQTSENPAPVG